MRATTLISTSFGLVAMAGAAIVGSAAKAQSAPVIYGSDPGPAHPRYAEAMMEPGEATAPQSAPQPRIVGQAAQSALVAASAAQVADASEAYAAPYRVPASSTTTPHASMGSAARAITVAPGDTVYSLSRQFGVSPKAIIAHNALEAPYYLQIGQEIEMPGDRIADEVASVATPIVTAPPVPRIAVAEPSAAPADELASNASLEIVVSAPQPLEYVSTSAAATSASAPTRPEPVERLDVLYSVREGDTLYSLSRRFGIDVGSLAKANDVEAPFTLDIGQRIVIPGGASVPVAASAVVPTDASAAPVIAAVQRPLDIADVASAASPAVISSDEIIISKTGASRFAWPLRGSIVKSYGMNAEGLRNDGINIAAPVGAPVRAAADGEVIYVGSELEGYGNLLLIRHEDNWVSAYAHTDAIIVGKGDEVRQGQVVAKVGDSGSVQQPQLHFELRHELKPRDPLAALEGRDQLASMEIDR